MGRAVDIAGGGRQDRKDADRGVFDLGPVEVEFGGPEVADAVILGVAGEDNPILVQKMVVAPAGNARMRQAGSAVSVSRSRT